MIVHQAISPKGYPLPFGILPQQLEVDEAIFVRIENALAIISALGDVVRQSHRNHSGNSGHLKIGGVSGELLARNRDLRSPSPVSSPVSPRFPPRFPSRAHAGFRSLGGHSSDFLNSPLSRPISSA